MKRTIYLLVCTLLSVQLFAQEKPIQSFSLQQAVEYAKKYNYILKNNALEVEAAQKKVNEVMAIGLPNISATGSFMHNIQIPTQSLPNFLKESLVGSAMGQAEAAYKQQNPGATDQQIQDIRNQTSAIVSKDIPDVIAAQFGQKYSTSASITATQLLFDGGFLMGVKASKEYVNVSKINLKRSQVETEVSVSKSYYSVLLIKTNIELISKNLDLLSKTRFEFEQLSKNGLLDKIEYDRVVLQYSSLELQRDRLIDQQKILLMVLKLQMGLDVNADILLTDDLEKMYTESKVALLSNKVDYNNRLEYQLVNQSISLNTLDKKRYQYGYTPSLAAFVTHQQNTFGTSFSQLGNQWFPGTYWGVNLNVPIFDGLKKNAQIQQSKINIRKAENDKRLLESVITQEVFSAKTNAERTAQQLDIQKKNFDLSQEIYDRTQLKNKNGLGSSLDLNISQRDLETARNSYLTTLYDYFLAQLELKKAMGEIK